VTPADGTGSSGKQPNAAIASRSQNLCNHYLKSPLFFLNSAVGTDEPPAVVGETIYRVELQGWQATVIGI